MTPVVKAKLDRILKYPFFSAVGQPFGDDGGADAGNAGVGFVAVARAFQ
jgi:hypothetical protein